VHYSAHPTILAGGNRIINPDYPGPVRRIVEASLGGLCLFLQGSPGDIGPIETFVDDLEPYHRLGSMLGHDAAATAWRSTARRYRQRPADHQDASTWLAFFEYEPQPPADSTLLVTSTTIHLPIRDDIGDPLEWRTQQRRLFQELMEAVDRGDEAMQIRELRVRTKGASMRAERAEALLGMTTYPLEVHGLRIGPLSFIGIPMEPFIELGLEIEARSPSPMTLVSGYTNGYRNYLPTEAEWARGGYEVDIAPFKPQAARMYVEAAVDVLERLAD
jgi:neutral ceramidase